MKIHHCILLAIAVATCLLTLAHTSTGSSLPAQTEPVVAIPWGGGS